MADARLKLIIEAMDNASDDLKRLKEELEGVDSSTKKSGQSTDSLKKKYKTFTATAAAAAAGIAAVGFALKKVYDLGKEGAALDYTAGKFDRLTDSIGTTTDALMRDLRAATKGTMSDMELMAGAGDLMSLGLAKSHEDVVRLSKVVGGLGMDMNQLVLTLTNKTTMRFDALGVSVDGFDEKVKALEQSGLDANEAFGEAFLQQAEMQLAKVGDKADTDAGKIARMEAATKNMGDAFKLWLAPGVATAAESVANFLTGGQQLEDSIDSLYQDLLDGKITIDEYTESMRKLAEQEEKNLTVADKSIRTMQGYSLTVEEAEDANLRLIESHAAIITKWRDAEPIGQDMNEMLRDQRDATSEVADVTWSAADAMQKYTDVLLFKIASEGLGEEAALRLAYKMGLVDDATVLATEKTRGWKSDLDNGKISVETYTALVAGLADKIASLESKEISITTNHYDNYYENNVAGAGAVGGKRGDPTMQATGGNVSRGGNYRWNEYGYPGEIMVPSMDGYILSRSDAERILSQAAQGGKGGGDTYNLVINEAGRRGDVVRDFEILKSLAR